MNTVKKATSVLITISAIALFCMLTGDPKTETTLQAAPRGGAEETLIAALRGSFKAPDSDVAADKVLEAIYAYCEAGRNNSAKVSFLVAREQQRLKDR